MANVKQYRVQATEPTYELQSLGWKAFQQLCISVLGDVWGQVIQGYFDSRDGGRDGAFHGIWSRSGGEIFEGSFTVQCKFSSRSEKTLQFSDLQDELEKARRLAARGLAENYLLFTSMRLTGTSEEKIKTAFEELPGIKHFAAYGRDRISQLIRESPRLRMLVPRIYGLGDLGQILDERAYAQAQEILSALGDDLAKFVITDAYRRSATAIIEHGFVMLLGEPACGKSTIAAALSLGALDEWSCFTLKLHGPAAFVEHSNPHEPKQFFWIDDAFGATQLDLQATVDWNRVFPHVQAAIRRGAKVVFTSRDYIYRNARNFLKESALPVLQESQVVIHVEDLAKTEREQILYNHIKLGGQSKKFKKQVKPFLPNVASHQRFSPEIARRLGSPVFTRKLSVSGSGLNDFVARPMELLTEIIRTLDSGSRSAIALIFMRGGALSSPMSLSSEDAEALSLLGGTPAEVRMSLAALEGSLLLQVQEAGTFSWRFKHPTIRDAFGAIVAENRELMDIYLLGTPIRQLLLEISCGDMGIRGTKVIVPRDRFATVILRIGNFLSASYESRDAVNHFLGSRCNDDFLSTFLSEFPNFISSLNVGSYLYAVPDIAVIVRLNHGGLLPDAERVRHVAQIRKLAVETPDSGFLRLDVRELFKSEEFDATIEDVHSKLLPELSDCVQNWASNCSSDEDPEGYFSELKSALVDYGEIFSGDDAAMSLIDAAMNQIEEVIDKKRSEMPEDPDVDDYYSRDDRGHSAGGARSIFDDVDQ